MSNVETARAWEFNIPDSQTTGDSSDADWICESPPITGKELHWRASPFFVGGGGAAPAGGTPSQPGAAYATPGAASGHCTRRPPRRPGASNPTLSDMETRTRAQAGNSMPAKNLHTKISSLSAECSGKRQDAHQMRPVKTCGGGDSVCAAGNARHPDSRPQQQQLQGGDAPSTSPPTPIPSPYPSPWQQQQGSLPPGAGVMWPWLPAPGTPSASPLPWYPLPPPGPWQSGAGGWPGDEQAWQAPNMQRSECGMECWMGCSCMSSRSRMDTCSETTQDSKPGSRRGRELVRESHRESPHASPSPRRRVPPSVALSAAVTAVHSAAASGTSSCVNEWPRLMYGSQLPLRRELDDLLVILKSTVDEVLVAASELIPSELSDLQLMQDTSLIVMPGASSAAAAALHNYCALGAFTHGLMDSGDCAASSMAVQLMDLIADTALELSRIPARVDLTRARFDASDEEGSGDAALSRSLRESVRPPAVSSDDSRFIGQYRAYLDLIRLPRDEGAGGDSNSYTSQPTHFDDLVGSTTASAMLLKTLDSRSEMAPSESTLAASECHRDQGERAAEGGGESGGGGGDVAGNAGAPAKKEAATESRTAMATVTSTLIASSTEEDEGVGGSDYDVGDAAPRDAVSRSTVSRSTVSRCANAGGTRVSDSVDASDAAGIRGGVGGSGKRGEGGAGGGDAEGATRGNDTVVLFQRSDTDSNQETCHPKVLPYHKASRRTQAVGTCERKSSGRWNQALSSEAESAVLVSPSTDTDDAVEMDVIVMPAVRCGGQERSSVPSAAPSPHLLSPDPATSSVPANDPLQQMERSGKATGVSKSKVKVLVNLDELTQRGCWNTEMCTMKQIQKITAPDVLTQTQLTTVATTVKVRPSVSHAIAPSHSGSSRSSASRTAARRRCARPAPRSGPRRRRPSGSRDQRASRSPSPGRHDRTTQLWWAEEREDRDHDRDREGHRRQSDRSPPPSSHRRSGYERRGSYRSLGSDDASEDEIEHRGRRGIRLVSRVQMSPRTRRRLHRVKAKVTRASSASSRFSRRERRRHESRRAPPSPRGSRWRRHLTSAHDAAAAAAAVTAPHALRVRVVASRPRYDDPASGDWACEWARISEDGHWGERSDRRSRRSPARRYRHQKPRRRQVTPEAEVEEEEAEEESVEEASGGSGFEDVEVELAGEGEEEESEETGSGAERSRGVAAAARDKAKGLRSSCESFSPGDGEGLLHGESAASNSSGEDMPDSAAALQAATRQHGRGQRAEQAEGDKVETSSPKRRTSTEASTRGSSPRLQDASSARTSRRLSRPTSQRVPNWPAGKGSVLDMPGISTLVDVVANSTSGFLKSCEAGAARGPLLPAQTETVAAATNTEGGSHREGRKEGTADEESDFISAVGSPRALLLPFLTSPGTDTETDSEVHEQSSLGSGETGRSEDPDLVTTVQRSAQNDATCRSPINNVEESKN